MPTSDSAVSEGYTLLSDNLTNRAAANPHRGSDGD